jgi:diguanylate cyclase (GGDEF)-like protein
VMDEPERRLVREQRYWLGVIDIDHFKQVNDQHGHLIGDEVLLLLSRVMRQSFRFLDKLYRFGGEEFVVLLRCPGEDGAMAALQRFRTQVEAYVFPRVQHVTVSVGFTDVRSGDTPPAAVERADMAVYYAKRHGRNQVRSHAALVREGELSDLVQTSDVEFF